MAERTDSDEDAVTETIPSVTQSAHRRRDRELERQKRIEGKLTDLTFTDICCTRDGRQDFIKQRVLMCVCGSKSQFDARAGRMKKVLPPLTGDCCQTFATLAAVLLASLGFAVMMQECCSPSSVNYILYISAWMHQLSASSWPQKGVRPTIRDLNVCLRLQEYFPAKVRDDEFEVVFYNQAARAQDLVRKMCSSSKRVRNADSKLPICGYVIVSGDYTVSIISVNHDIKGVDTSRYSHAWSFYICDSHGTQPWSQGKASISGITFGTPRDVSTACDDIVTTEDGIHYFSTILFTLLEAHRHTGPRISTVPYMTWTPVRRRRCLAYTARELKEIIDKHWIPKVLCSETIHKESVKYGFHPIPCFWGMVQTEKSKA